MPRRFFSDGQEIKFTDFNVMTSPLERELYDRVLRELMGRRSDVFFAGSFKVTRTNATTISVAAGNGIQYDSSQDDPEPNYRPLYLPSAAAASITSAHATYNRIDIVCVKANRATTLTESRNVKALGDATISAQSLACQKDWLADVVITAGTPSGSPATPSTPSGYIKIATLVVTAVTGIAASGAITDNRVLMPTNREFDAEVGVLGTHGTLAEAVAACSAGGKILVLDSEALATTVVISNANTEVVLKPGVVLSDSGCGTGIQLSATGCRIVGGKFSGFTTQAILIDSGSNYSIIGETRFSSTCTASITDNNGKTAVFGTIDET
jgi:hypothetical protein